MLDLRFARYYRYPHYHWAVALADVLRGIDLDPETTIIDAPCGDGVISFWLMKRMIGRRYELYDISEREIERANRLRAWKTATPLELSITRGDISEIDLRRSTADVWLLINSLFLLPDIDQLMSRMRQRAKYIVGLFPDVNHRNYGCFVKLDPHTNSVAMDRQQTISFFDRHGYALRQQKDTSHIAYHCLKPKRVRQLSRFFLNPVEYVVPKRNACYWIGLFSRDD